MNGPLLDPVASDASLPARADVVVVGGGIIGDLVAGDAPVLGPAPFRHRRRVDGSDPGTPGMM